jgi:hypothetical protein
MFKHASVALTEALVPTPVTDLSYCSRSMKKLKERGRGEN